MFKRAQRMNSFHTSVFTELLEEKKRYEKEKDEKVIDFSLGSPTIPPSPSIIKTMTKAVSIPSNYRYAVMPISGMISSIQKWYQSRYQTSLEENEITLLQGSQEALVNLPLIYCNPGDIVLVPDPYYPVYVDAPRLAGANIHFMPLKAENNYLIDLDAIPDDVAQKAKMMIVCYPNNPTGACAPDSFINDLIAFARKNNILVVYDNAYSDLVYTGVPGRSFLSFDHAIEVGVEINSFSKSYGMAGARLGVLLGNQEVVEAYKVLKSNMDYGVFIPVQEAGIAALESGSSLVKETQQRYEHKRDLMVDSFRLAGWELPCPKATMFIWARIPEKYKNCYEFCHELLKATGVMVTPGTAFGPMGERYVRLSFVLEEEDILEAASRIRESQFFLKSDYSD
ncbi:aminotransferase class I/II-fold pyridoxal phosphate-dependent enzyme [Ileibacterium valens]|uniref:aminotransferase class I/II-fold pyridoxal phosphate-dependent enzyme n=1 Tax=Ileibacterium valens TaxID=1862668 RepID=UPI00272B798B|nr:aminotransferase class I/II-fold pyridoxal phosphate-dependent enzyme [Ileibacterium valens]